MGAFKWGVNDEKYRCLAEVWSSEPKTPKAETQEEVHVPVLLQPILAPVKGAPDIVLSIDPMNPEELFVYLGMAMLEKAPHGRL